MRELDAYRSVVYNVNALRRVLYRNHSSDYYGVRARKP